jgi:diguanylate cyclase (GGDEF)-like protein
LVVVVAIYVIDRTLFKVPNPGAISFLAVVLSAYLGGIVSGLVSTAISLGYAAVAFSLPGQLFHYQPDNLSRLYVLVVATPAIAVMVGMLQARERNAVRRLHEGRAKLEIFNAELLALRAALDHVDYGIVLLDRELRAQYINRAFRAMWRLPDEVAERKPAFVGLMYHGRDIGAYAVSPQEIDRYVAEQTAQVRAGDERPTDVVLADGQVICLRCKVLPDGGRMLTYANVTARLAREPDLEEPGMLDSMTGLCNRRYFLKLAEGEWGRFRRYGQPLSLLVLEIDRFDTVVGESYGHETADHILGEVADICRHQKRNCDIVARLGAAEFALLLPETGIDAARAVGERLREAVTQHGALHVSERMTASIGVSAADREMSGVTDLIKQADIALYAAKAAGRNCVRAFGLDPTSGRDATTPATAA